MLARAALSLINAAARSTPLTAAAVPFARFATSAPFGPAGRALGRQQQQQQPSGGSGASGKMQQGEYQTAAAVREASAATGAPAGHATGPNIVNAIIDDHQRLFGWLRQLQGPSVGYDEAERLRHHIVHDLSVHSLAEEEVLYPALKNALGKDIRDHVLDEHTELKHILKDVDKMKADDVNFRPRIDELHRALKHHVQEEEDNVLPAFANRVDTHELMRLGEKFEQTKGRVPTRPHTMAPDKPKTGNVVVDRMTAPIDKARDAISRRDV